MSKIQKMSKFEKMSKFQKNVKKCQNFKKMFKKCQKISKISKKRSKFQKMSRTQKSSKNCISHPIIYISYVSLIRSQLSCVISHLLIELCAKHWHAGLRPRLAGARERSDARGRSPLATASLVFFIIVFFFKASVVVKKNFFQGSLFL